MDIRKLQRAIVDGLEDVKAQDIVVFNTEHLSPLFERVIVASGTSNRQTKALASSVRDAVKTSGGPLPRMEGEENGEWIIVDCGAAVAHIMQPAMREYYNLEEIWGGKPVAMKFSRAAKALVKASSYGDDDDPPAAKASTRSSKAAKPGAPKTATRTAAKTAATKPVGARSGAPAAKKAAPGKSAAGKSAAGKTVARQAAPKRSEIPPSEVKRRASSPGTVTRIVVKPTTPKKASPATKSAPRRPATKATTATKAATAAPRRKPTRST